MPLAVSLIVAFYCLMRAIQIPIEHSQSANKVPLLSLIALIFGLAIGFLTLDLIMS